MDISKIEEVIWQKEEDLARGCPSSGKNTGRSLPVTGSDEWYIQCPECGTRWAGGSTVLADHDRWR